MKLKPCWWVILAVCIGCGPKPPADTPPTASTSTSSNEVAHAATALGEIVEQPSRYCCSTGASIAVSPDSRLIVTALGNDYTAWDLESGLELQSFRVPARYAKNSTRTGPVENYSTVAFDPSGHYLAATKASFANRVSLTTANALVPPVVWDLETGRDLSDVEWTVAPGGQRLTAPGFPFEPHEPVFWQISNVRGVPSRLAATAEHLAGFSPDGTLAARVTGDDNAPCTIDILEVASGRSRWTTTVDGPRRQYAGFRVDRVFFSADNRWVAASGFLFLHVWDAATGREVRPSNSAWFDETNLGAFSPDGRSFAILNGRNSGRVLSTTDWTTTTQLDVAKNGDPVAFAFSADGRRLLRLATTGIQVWDAATGRSEKQIPFSRSQVATSIAVSSDGSSLAIGTEQTETPGGIWLWPLKGRTEPQVVRSDLDASVVSLAFDRDGHRLVAATLSDRPFAHRANGVVDGNIDVCDLPSCQSPVRLLDGSRRLPPSRARNHTGTSEAAASRAFFLADGKTLIAAVEGRSAYTDEDTRFLEFEAYPRLVFYGATDLRVQRSAEPEGSAFNALAISRNGQLAATGQEATVRLWDVARRRELRVFQTTDPNAAHSQNAVIRSVAFDPGNKWLAAAGDDQQITIWDVTTGGVIRVVGDGPLAYHALAVSDAGRLLVASRCDASGKREIVAWDTTTWTARWTIADDRRSCSDDIVVSRDERWVAITDDVGVRVYDAVAGHPLLTIATNRNQAWLAWTPDGRYAGNKDGIALLAGVRRGRDMNTLESLPAGNLVPDLLARVLGTP